MKIPIIEQIRRRLFVKISLVVVLALIFVLTSIRPIQRYFFDQAIVPAMIRNTINYGLYILDDLGTPPDYNKAKQLGEKLKFMARYQSPEAQWTTNKDIVEFSSLELQTYDEKKGIYTGHNRQGICIEFRKKDQRLLLVIQAHNKNFLKAVHYFTLAIGLLVTIAIIGVYFAVNWLLKPIKHLHEGVKQLSEGNIDYEMATKRNDELGKLVDSFNVMTRRIREMLQAREQLLLDVSHELRSPLTRVKVALEFMEDGEGKSNIHEDITEMETMITELLETDRLNSRHGGLKLAPVNLPALFREVAVEFDEQKPGIKFVSFPEEMVLQLDFKRICILARNIIGNALRYSEPEGYPIEVSLREKRDEIIVSIQDFGIGIPEQDLPFVFEPFYRVDKSRSKKTGGYGLGMSLSKRIMEAHNGKIEISSRINTGTTVFLKFKR